MQNRSNRARISTMIGVPASMSDDTALAKQWGGAALLEGRTARHAA
jgi:hypothetical protein